MCVQRGQTQSEHSRSSVWSWTSGVSDGLIQVSSETSLVFCIKYTVHYALRAGCPNSDDF